MSTYDKSVLEDLSWLKKSESFLSSRTSKKDFFDDANWLVQQYKIGKHANELDKSNKRIIEHLNNLLLKNVRDKRAKYTEKEVLDIINFLKTTYAN